MIVYSGQAKIKQIGDYTFHLERYDPQGLPKDVGVTLLYVAWHGDRSGTGDTPFEAILNCCEKWLAKEAQS